MCIVKSAKEEMKTIQGVEETIYLKSFSENILKRNRVGTPTRTYDCVKNRKPLLFRDIHFFFFFE